MFWKGDVALDVQSVHGRGQGMGWGVAYGRRGRQPSIGHRRKWLGGPGGEVVEGGLPPTPWSAQACAGWPRASEERERGLARAGTSRWGTGVSPGRWGGADWGCRVERVRERGR
jgi:hypothetical protein